MKVKILLKWVADGRSSRFEAHMVQEGRLGANLLKHRIVKRGTAKEKAIKRLSKELNPLPGVKLEFEWLELRNGVLVPEYSPAVP